MQIIKKKVNLIVAVFFLKYTYKYSIPIKKLKIILEWSPYLFYSYTVYRPLLHYLSLSVRWSAGTGHDNLTHTKKLLFESICKSLHWKTGVTGTAKIPVHRSHSELQHFTSSALSSKHVYTIFLKGLSSPVLLLLRFFQFVLTHLLLYL